MKTSLGKLIGLIAYILTQGVIFIILAYSLLDYNYELIQDCLGANTLIFAIVWGAVGANNFVKKLKQNVDK